MNIAMENRTHYHITLAFPSEDTNEILESLKLFKKYIDEFFIQFQLKGKGKGKGYSHLLETYNNEIGTWKMPLDEILDITRKYAKKK
jgi:hypothetical protein